MRVKGEEEGINGFLERSLDEEKWSLVHKTIDLA